MYLFEGLKQKVSTYLTSDLVDLIQQAYVVAHDAHDGQMRSSGDPYITHPIAVAGIMAEMRLDHETVMAALLHDVIEDTALERDDLEALFGAAVADMVEGVSKLDKISFSSKEEAQAENFRKMMMAMVQDIRVILIKLADRTHNMRTLGALRPDKRRRIARETLDIYAPIAHRLGIHDIKNELEDLGFQAMHPMRHRALGQAVREARGNRKHIIESTQKDIDERLQGSGLRAIIKGREKHLYSIYRKMQNKELLFHEVMDIYAFRLVMDDVDSCYRALGVVHGLFKPVEDRFKDYIAIPRTNGYQSLHTSLVGPHGIPIEIQIRTLEMDHMADKGIAAHWSYKQVESDSSNSMAQSRMSKWTQSLLELQQNASSSFEFIENVKTDLFPDEIYVFTPDGRIVELPLGATPVDFAYAVHTAIGNTCVGARVDRRAFSLSRPLENGQTVEIITSPNAQPNANWLNFIVSARARSHVRQYLRKQRAEEALCMGTRLLRHALGIDIYDNLSSEEKQRVAIETNHDSFDHLLSEIGLGNEMSGIVARRFLQNTDVTNPQDNFADDPSRRVSIRGADGLLVTFARCCYPIPGDHIAAFLSPGKGMVVHQEGCRNLKRMLKEEPQRVLSMEWEPDTQGEYKASVKIELMHHQGVLATLTQVIASCGSNVIGFQTEEKDHNIYFIEIELTVTDRVHLARVTRKIRNMDEVLKVARHSQLKSS